MHNFSPTAIEPTNPTSVPLPVSPQSSHGDFDALIELLASDEARVKPNVNARGGQTDLRDANGQLDFSKIRDMFSLPSVKDGTEQYTVNPNRNSGTGLNTPADNLKFSTLASPLRTSSIPTLQLSPIQHTTMGSQGFGIGIPPAESTPIPTARTLQIGNTTASPPYAPWDLNSETNKLPPNNAYHEPELSTSSLLDLKQALELAQRDVMGLRQRCRELEELRTSSNTSLPRNSFDSPQPIPSTSSQSQAPNDKNSSTHTRQVPADEDIHRALEMVIFVDELVWKRSRFGAEYQDPYCAENVQKLQDRLALWERAVRSRK